MSFSQKYSVQPAQQTVGQNTPARGATPPQQNTQATPPHQPQIRQGQEFIGCARRISAKGKFLSFEPVLALASELNYPALHSGLSSNKEDGFKSLVRAICTQYDCKPAVTVSANLPPDDCFYLLEAVKQRLFMPVEASALAGMKESLNLLRQAFKEGAKTPSAIAAGKRLAAAVAEAEKATGETVYSREIINPHKALGNNRFPVRKMRVDYNPLRKDGSVSRYPWCITIDNGSGVLQRNQTGGNSCQSGSFKSEGKVFCNATSQDLYKTLRGVCSYIEVWEQNVAGPQVLRKESERISRSR